LNVIGLVTVKPRTEDYVPLLPWLGVVLIGVALGTVWRRNGFALAPALRKLNEVPPRWLVFFGVWSLTVYLLHQPVLMGILWVVSRSV